jgi:energy-converting hydrogenase Eha subunit C
LDSTTLKKALAIVLTWLPALFWLIFAAAGVVMGAGGLFSEDPEHGLLFIALGVAGILGFVGLTVTCWTRKPVGRMLAIFLFCGVTSLLVAVGYLVVAGDWDLRDPVTILYLVYFVVCPVGFAISKIGAYFKASTGPA